MDIGIILKIAAVGILTAVVNQVLKKAVFLSDGIGSLRRCIPVMQELGCFGVPHLCLHVLYS